MFSYFSCKSCSIKQISSGQGLTEYSLIAALIAIALIAALIPLGQSISGGFLNILGSNSSKTMATNEPASGINAVSSMEKSLSSLGASKDVTLSGNHTDVDLTPKATIQTIGARGTSEKVYASANQLRKIAEQLKKEDADPGLVDLITRLANAGHTIGDTLTTAEQQADLNMPAINDAETNFGNVKSELDTYLKEHPNLLTSDQQQTIDLHAADISTSPATFMTNEVLATQDEDIRSSSPVSQSVHNSSNSICNNGGNSNSCTK